MREITSNEKNTPLCLALGFFDSVHYGHKKLLRRAIEWAEELGAHSAATTFANNPFAALSSPVKLIYTYEERKMLFDELGVEYLLTTVFDDGYKDKPAREFLSELFSRFNIKAVVCGYDYTFGKNREGTVEALSEECARLGVKIEIFSRISLDDERVSSTAIRNFLAEGSVNKAAYLLTRPYFIVGEVQHGRGVGRTLGYPTANLAVSDDKCALLQGVYATTAVLGGRRFKAITNYGARPTFNVDGFLVETFIAGLSEEIYGETLVLEFVSYLRPVIKFAQPRLLAEQIEIDLQARTILD